MTKCKVHLSYPEVGTGPDGIGTGTSNQLNYVQLLSDRPFIENNISNGVGAFELFDFAFEGDGLLLGLAFFGPTEDPGLLTSGVSFVRSVVLSDALVEVGGESDVEGPILETLDDVGVVLHGQRVSG